MLTFVFSFFLTHCPPPRKTGLVSDETTMTATPIPETRRRNQLLSPRLSVSCGPRAKRGVLSKRTRGRGNGMKSVRVFGAVAVVAVAVSVVLRVVLGARRKRKDSCQPFFWSLFIGDHPAHEKVSFVYVSHWCCNLWQTGCSSSADLYLSIVLLVFLHDIYCFHTDSAISSLASTSPTVKNVT
jgi:hypothetical protein